MFKWVIDHLNDEKDIYYGVKLILYNILYLLVYQFMLHQRKIKLTMDGFKCKMMVKTLLFKKLLRIVPGSKETSSDDQLQSILSTADFISKLLDRVG